MNWFDSAGDEQDGAVKLVTQFFEHLAQGRDEQAAALLLQPGVLGPGKLTGLKVGHTRALLPNGVSALGDQAAQLFDGPLGADDAVVFSDLDIGGAITLGAVVDRKGGRIRRLFDPAPFKAAAARL